MFPKVTNGHVDVQLTNVLMAYTNDDFVAEKILPTVPNLAKETGLIASVGNAHLRQYSSKRELYDENQHRMNFTISNDDSYRIDYYDLESYVPDRLMTQLDSPFNARNIAQKSAMDALLLEREIGLAALMTSTTVLTQNTTLSGSSQYSDPSNSNPDTDFDTARDAVFSGIGREANALHMSRGVANALRRHPFFLEIAHSKLRGGNRDALSMETLVATLKDWYNLEFVTIGKSIKVTSQEGQTETKGTVWGDDVVFYYRPTAPALMAPSFGYSFQLAGKNRRTTVRREPIADQGELVRAEWAYQDKILDTNAAYLIKDAV